MHSRVMADTIVEDKSPTKADQWRARVSEQAHSGLSVKQFCKERGLSECSFYAWRRRLRDSGPVRFALVERGAGRQQPATEVHLELIFARGERLRIGCGVDAATLRTVVEALRA